MRTTSVRQQIKSANNADEVKYFVCFIIGLNSTLFVSDDLKHLMTASPPYYYLRRSSSGRYEVMEQIDCVLLDINPFGTLTSFVTIQYWCQ
jgi:hypothetical protein